MIVTREATANDAKFLFDLANEPLVRAMSFQTDPIPWETHVAWLEGVLADPDRRLWVHETWDGVTMATTRLEVCGRHEAVSLAIHPDHREQGRAHQLIMGLCRRARLPLLAEIKPENVRSIRAFEGAGFIPAGPGRWIKY